MLHLLYPSEPFDLKTVASVYREEYEEASRHYSCSLVDLDGHPDKALKLPQGSHVLYRGWMLHENQYEALTQKIKSAGATPVTSTGQYIAAHHLPNWLVHPEYAALTPKTEVVPVDADFEAVTARLGWKRYFVKDYVKSLTTSRRSMASDAKEIREVIGLLKHFRGEIEGQICLREVEDFKPETEKRIFVVKGKYYPEDSGLEKLDLPIISDFYSVDVVWNKEGQMRIVELGDGQVSDYKNWPVSDFVSLFNHLNQ